MRVLMDGFTIKYRKTKPKKKKKKPTTPKKLVYLLVYNINKPINNDEFCQGVDAWNRRALRLKRLS